MQMSMYLVSIRFILFEITVYINCKLTQFVSLLYLLHWACKFKGKEIIKWGLGLFKTGQFFIIF